MFFHTLLIQQLVLRCSYYVLLSGIFWREKTVAWEERTQGCPQIMRASPLKNTSKVEESECAASLNASERRRMEKRFSLLVMFLILFLVSQFLLTLFFFFSGTCILTLAKPTRLFGNPATVLLESKLPLTQASTLCFTFILQKSPLYLKLHPRLTFSEIKILLFYEFNYIFNFYLL